MSKLISRLNFFLKPKNFWFFLSSRHIINFISDKAHIRISYYLNTKRKINFVNPKCFNEKLQVLKLIDRKPIYTIMADKIKAKEYVSSIIGEKYIIPTLEIWDKSEQIEFSNLPDQFVIKCNHNSGGGLFICKNKDLADITIIKKVIKKELKTNYYWDGREWPYKNIVPKCFAEKLMVDENVPKDQNDGLIDYKFYCFNGEPKFLYIGFANIKNNIKHDYVSYYNLDFTPCSFGRSDHKRIPFQVNKPDNFEQMIDIARKLSVGTLFVRVDLYNINGSIYFSEFTFYPGGGKAPFEPFEKEVEIGSWLKIPENYGSIDESKN